MNKRRCFFWSSANSDKFPFSITHWKIRNEKMNEKCKRDKKYWYKCTMSIYDKTSASKIWDYLFPSSSRGWKGGGSNWLLVDWLSRLMVTKLACWLLGYIALLIPQLTLSFFFSILPRESHILHIKCVIFGCIDITLVLYCHGLRGSRDSIKITHTLLIYLYGGQSLSLHI